MKASFVVLNWNSEDFLLKSMKSIRDLNIPHGWSVEIVLVDNASTENQNILDAAKELCDVYLPLDRNYGFTGGMNRGLQATTGDWIVALNSDAALERSFLTHLSKCIAEEKPDIISVTVLKWDRFGGLDHFTNEVISQGASLNLRASMSGWKEGDRATLIGSDGSAQIFSRRAYESLSRDGQLYDELYGSYGEDLDVMLRAYSKNLVVKFCRQAINWHIGSASVNTRANSGLIHNISTKALENKWLTIFKTSGRIKPVLVLFSAFEDLLRLRNPAKVVSLYRSVLSSRKLNSDHAVNYDLVNIKPRLSLLSRYSKNFVYSESYENPLITRGDGNESKR